MTDIAGVATIAAKAATLDVAAEHTATPVAEVSAHIAATEAGRVLADYGIPGDETDADAFASTDVREGIAAPSMAIDNDVVDVDRDGARRERLIDPAIEGKRE